MGDQNVQGDDGDDWTGGAKDGGKTNGGKKEKGGRPLKGWQRSTNLVLSTLSKVHSPILLPTLVPCSLLHPPAYFTYALVYLRRPLLPRHRRMHSRVPLHRPSGALSEPLPRLPPPVLLSLPSAGAIAVSSWPATELPRGLSRPHCPDAVVSLAAHAPPREAPAPTYLQPAALVRPLAYGSPEKCWPRGRSWRCSSAVA